MYKDASSELSKETAILTQSEEYQQYGYLRFDEIEKELKHIDQQ